jgi:MFS family permease
MPFLLTFGPFVLFQLGCALAKNEATLLLCRFFAGTLGSAPLTNAGAQISDMFAARQRS